MKLNDPSPVVNLVRRWCVEIAYPSVPSVGVAALTRSLAITIVADQDGTPRLIGTGGSVFKAIQVLSRVIGLGYGFKVSIPWLPDPGGQREARENFRHVAVDWPKERVLPLLKDTALAVFRDQDAVSISHCDVTTGAQPITMAEIVVSKDEEPSLVGLVAEPFNVLFEAMARAHRGTLKVEITAVAEPTLTNQPSSSDGRYSKEVEL